MATPVPATFAPGASPPPIINPKEVATDGLSMVAIDGLNNLSLTPDLTAYGGMAVGLGLWQMWGKGYLKKNLQKLSLNVVASDPKKAEAIVEYDAELLFGLKGGLYSLSVYLTSLAVKGRSDRMNLVDAVMIGYGGSLSGAVVRNSLSA